MKGLIFILWWEHRVPAGPKQVQLPSWPLHLLLYNITEQAESCFMRLIYDRMTHLSSPNLYVNFTTLHTWAALFISYTWQACCDLLYRFPTLSKWQTTSEEWKDQYQDGDLCFLALYYYQVIRQWCWKCSFHWGLLNSLTEWFQFLNVPAANSSPNQVVTTLQWKSSNGNFLTQGSNDSVWERFSIRHYRRLNFRTETLPGEIHFASTVCFFFTWEQIV